MEIQQKFFAESHEKLPIGRDLLREGISRMGGLENLSVRAKLNVLAVFSVGLALSIAAWSLRYSSRAQFQDNLKTELQSLAMLIGRVEEASIVANEPSSTQRFLNGLTAKPNIVVAIVLAPDDRPLATYFRPNVSNSAFTGSPRGFGIWCGPAHCTAVYPIEIKKAIVGRVVLISDLEGLNLALRDNAKSLGWALLSSVVIALLIANFLQGFISRPLVKLAALLHQISSNQDYSLRFAKPNATAENERKNEIGKLVAGLNHMLEEIEAKDRALVAARGIAEAAMMAKSQFVANVGHEIRTPINNIVGFSEILAGKVESPDERRSIEMIQRSAASLLIVVSDVLDISRIEAGRFGLDAFSNNLNLHLQELLKEFQDTAEQSDLAFAAFIDERLPELLHVDSLRFGKVVRSLLNNALMSTSVPGKVTFVLEVIHLREREVKIRVAVHDTGMRKSPVERLEGVFTPSSLDCSGLGFVISQKVVSLMGGRIHFENEGATGSTYSFQLRIPISDCSKAKIAAGEFSAKLTNQAFLRSPERGDSFRVLVVEDNPMSREITVHRLTRLGLTVLAAESGEEAIVIAGRERLDLILMDCQMPTMNGFEATAQIRAEEVVGGERVPIVALSAHPVEGYRQLCLDAGMDEYFAKPIHEAQLLEYLAQLPSARRFFRVNDSEKSGHHVSV